MAGKRESSWTETENENEWERSYGDFVLRVYRQANEYLWFVHVDRSDSPPVRSGKTLPHEQYDSVSGSWDAACSSCFSAVEALCAPRVADIEVELQSNKLLLPGIKFRAEMRGAKKELEQQAEDLRLRADKLHSRARSMRKIAEALEARAREIRVDDE
jgi:hypothetical protein